jgi:hypothetical protein
MRTRYFPFSIGGRRTVANFRRVFETALIPQLATRSGPWALCPTFSGSTMIGGADVDLIAAGLLLELKTSAKLTLAIEDLFQVIGYALLDFDTRTSSPRRPSSAPVMPTWLAGASATCSASWPGTQSALQTARQQFRQLLAVDVSA